MVLTGVICGICLGFGYGVLFKFASYRSWIKYNMSFMAMLFLLGISSIFFFEPVTSLTALTAANERPDGLIIQAAPLTILFTLSFPLILARLYARNLLQDVVILATSSILMILPGLSISIPGLVYIPIRSFLLISELFGLVIIIVADFALVYMIMENKYLLDNQQHR